MSIEPSIASVVAACTAASHAGSHGTSSRGQKHGAVKPSAHAVSAPSGQLNVSLSYWTQPVEAGDFVT